MFKAQILKYIIYEHHFTYFHTEILEPRVNCLYVEEIEEFLEDHKRSIGA